MRDDPPEEMSVEEYLNLEEKGKPKKKAKIKKPRKGKNNPPVYCEKCKKRITGEDSTANPVTNGKAEHYHWRCYYGEEKADAQEKNSDK